MIVSAGKSESFEYAYPIGIGLMESAISLTQLCLMDRPEFLIFIGSAGSYGEKKIGDIVTSEGAANLELSFLQNKSYTPIDNVIVSNSGIVSHETIVNSSNYVTTDLELSKEYSSHKIALENMEFFSVMSIAKEFNIPAAGVFIVTNYCDEDAHEEFLKNHKESMEKLDKYVRKNILSRFQPKKKKKK